MNTQHSPGPWRIEDRRSTNGAFWIMAKDADGRGEHSIAEVRPGCAEAEEAGDAEANAHLIVAAPNMVAALRKAMTVHLALRDVCRNAPSLIALIDAVIAKAEGNAP